MNNSEPLFCKKGDILKFIKDLETNPWPDEEKKIISEGDCYQAQNVVGYGWDLEKVKGNGPKFVRILNSEMKNYLIIIKTISNNS